LVRELIEADIRNTTSNSKSAHTQRMIYAYLAMALIATMLAMASCAGEGKGNQPDPARGASIYAADCLVCHGEAASDDPAIPTAPTHGPEGHTWHHADGQLMQIILGELQFPGKTMQPFEGKLTEADVLDVLAYLKTGWEPNQVEFQAEVTKSWVELQKPSQ
jgi:mono/diheme cytochrome c family protein